jgi:hypothetical protein
MAATPARAGRERRRFASPSVLGVRCQSCDGRAMWRTLLGIDPQTRAEKRASVNGLNLFFGALIGANLGSLEQLALRDYTLLISMICLIVLYIQLAPVARQRWLYLAILLMTVVGLYVLLLTPQGLRFFENRPRPAPHLFVTICVWLFSVAYVELRPLAKNEAPAAQRP